MKTQRQFSYTAAGQFPMKLLCHPDLVKSAKEHHKILSMHWQLNPCNGCNFTCPFCSCGGRDPSLMLSLEDVEAIYSVACLHGCISTTITGGGEPLAHPLINEIIKILKARGIQMGLVTNGSLLSKLEHPEYFRWIRISASDELPGQLKRIKSSFPDWMGEFARLAEKHPQVGWAFSYVVGLQPNIHLIKQMIQSANDCHFTHMRIVNDILQAEGFPDQIRALEAHLARDPSVDLSRVIFQDRSIYVHGRDPCLISLLKPVIGADGYLYPCCGTQYALPDPSRDYEKRMRMGHINDLQEILTNQKFFGGSICVKCYYEPYNLALHAMLNGLDHAAFV